MHIEKPKYNKTDNEVVLIIKNNGSEDITFGERYQIEKYNNGSWSTIPFQDNFVIPGIQNRMNRNVNGQNCLDIATCHI